MTDSRDTACGECPLIERRAFVRDISLALAGMALALGAGPSRAAAMPIAFGNALRRRGDEHIYPLPAEDGATIDRDNDIIIARYQHKVYAFSLACPHRRVALHWEPENGQFQCPKHHSRYRPDGVFIDGRATRAMDRFGIRREGNTVAVDVSRYFRQDEDTAGWESALVAV
jgi:nitrite reductase/ring-hydroxylating ferredoxin subunit